MSRVQPKALLTPETTTSDPLPVITASANRLAQQQRVQAAIRKAGPTKPGQLASNLTHYSPADPEARIAFKTCEPRLLAYLASVSVDVARQVITHIHADLADWRDSRYLLAIVAATRQRLQTFGLDLSRVVERDMARKLRTPGST